MTSNGSERNGDDRFRVLWLTPDKPADVSVGRRRIADHLREDGFDVTLRGTTPWTVVDSLRERDEYDAVVGTTRAGAFAGGLLKILGTPFVVDHVDPIRQFTETSWLLSFGVRLAENVAFALADHVLYVYDEERERVERYARAATETDLGVSYDRFADPDPAVVGRARERLVEAGVGTDERIVIYVGGLEPIYHITELLAAMDRLDRWTLVVLGAGSLEEQVERAANERENVVFLGTVGHDAVPGHLRAADVGVCLVDDPHTLKLLEYAAAGLPAVQLRGRAEIRFGNHVEYCEPNPGNIACAIRQANDRTKDDRDAFREHAAHFDYGQIAAAYAAVVQQISDYSI